MTLSERVAELVRAAFPGLWVVSHEHDDAVAELNLLCRERGWCLAEWDLERGLTVHRSDHAAEPGSNPAEPFVADGADPMAALRALPRLATSEGEGDGATLLVLRNLHRLLGSAELVQALDAALSRGKQTRTTLVILAPAVALPPELERQFVVVEHELPGRGQLGSIARSIATEPGEFPDEGPELDAVLDAAVGLTRLEAEGAVALSLVRHGRVRPETLWELKSQALTRSGLMSLHRGGEGFAGLGGLESLKTFCSRALRPDRPAGVRPKGVLLLGVPGTGKSAFAKALGNEVGRPTLVMDVGALMGSLVGQTEERTRQALAIADAMAPSLVFIDEIDKALSGIQSGGRSDGGVSGRLFGSLLSWLSDRDSDVFVIATCNDISALPPEFARAERWDAVFFLDLPSTREKSAIWELYIRRYDLDPAQRRPADRQWTGAEIRSCCRLARLLDLSLIESARQIVPVAATASEAVDRLRTWASGRCLSAEIPGLYARPSGEEPGRTAGRPGRRVGRDGPSAN